MYEPDEGEKEQRRAKEYLKIKSITQQNYTRERHYFTVKLRTAFEFMNFFIVNRKLPEFSPAKLCLGSIFGLSLGIHTAFIAFRPLSFLKNITTFSVLLGTTFAFYMSMKTAFHSIATQDTEQGRKARALARKVGLVDPDTIIFKEYSEKFDQQAERKTTPPS